MRAETYNTGILQYIEKGEFVSVRCLAQGHLVRNSSFTTTDLVDWHIVRLDVNNRITESSVDYRIPSLIGKVCKTGVKSPQNDSQGQM